MFGVLGVASPHVGDPDASGKRQRTVDHEDAAVHAVVQLLEVEPAQRAEEGYVHPGVPQPLHVGGVELGRAVAVEDQVDLDTGPDTVDERLAEPVGDATWPVDVGGAVDRLLRRGDRIQHGVEGGAVVHDPDAVAEARDGPRHGREQAGKLGGARRRGRRHLEALARPPLVLGHLVGHETRRAQYCTPGNPANRRGRHDQALLLGPPRRRGDAIPAIGILDVVVPAGGAQLRVAADNGRRPRQPRPDGGRCRVISRRQPSGRSRRDGRRCPRASPTGTGWRRRW